MSLEQAGSDNLGQLDLPGPMEQKGCLINSEWRKHQNMTRRAM
jgi:hypothetical protein